MTKSPALGWLPSARDQFRPQSSSTMGPTLRVFHTDNIRSQTTRLGLQIYCHLAVARLQLDGSRADHWPAELTILTSDDSFEVVRSEVVRRTVDASERNYERTTGPAEQRVLNCTTTTIIGILFCARIIASANFSSDWTIEWVKPGFHPNAIACVACVA